MSKLQLSIAMGDYDRTRALYDGRVQIDGVDPVYMLLNPEEMFFRAMRSVDFDITELSFSSYLVRHARGDCPYIALPVFGTSAPFSRPDAARFGSSRRRPSGSSASSGRRSAPTISASMLASATV